LHLKQFNIGTISKKQNKAKILQKIEKDEQKKKAESDKIIIKCGMLRVFNVLDMIT
jgi:hypothetical protein